MRIIKRIALALGIIGLPVSAYLLVSGGILVASNSLEKDIDGFYDTWDLHIEKDSYAIVMKPEGIEIAPGFEVGSLNTFKVEAVTNDPSNKIFIGTAGEWDINAYLGDADYDEIADLYIFPTRADYRNHPGSIIPGDPVSQSFWIESTYGTGMQTLNWEIEPERPWLVVINENVTAGLDIDVVFCSKAPLLFTAGIGNIFFGVVILITALLLMSFSGKSRNIIYPEPLQYLFQQRQKAKTGS